MKVLPSTKPFTPVAIELETQEEVDSLYALLNTANLCNATGFTTDDRKQLKSFTTCSGREAYYSEYCRIMK